MVFYHVFANPNLNMLVFGRALISLFRTGRGIMIKIFLCLAGLVLLSFACTGMAVTPHYGATNTNPVPEYATIATLAYGGGMYHANSVAGQAGNALLQAEGRACSHSVLWLVAWGDSRLSTAAKNGSIKKIGFVEYEVRALGGFFYHRFCTVVRGET